MTGYYEHIRRLVQLERNQKADHMLLTAPLPPTTYHWQLLNLANRLFEAAQIYVLNPRCVNSASLFDADSEWLEDFHRYRQWIQFERDKYKRPPELR